MTQIQHLVRGHSQVKAGRGAMRWRGAGGDQHSGGTQLAMADRDRVGPKQTRAPWRQFDARLGQHRAIDAFEAIEFALLCIGPARHLEAARHAGPAESFGLV